METTSQISELQFNNNSQIQNLEDPNSQPTEQSQSFREYRPPETFESNILPSKNKFSQNPSDLVGSNHMQALASKRENFAVSLRKSKRDQILSKKRSKLGTSKR